MARGVVKYSPVYRSEILRLYAIGHTRLEIGELLGVHRNTITYWINKYKLSDLMERYKSEAIHGVIEQGLRNLAIGATSSEVTKEYMEEDEEGKMIKVTKKTKKSNPNEKAMQILAKKYHKEIAADSDIVDTQSQVNININTSDMSLRELQQVSTASPLGGIIDASYMPVTASDTNDRATGDTNDRATGDTNDRAKDALSHSELLPPTKDS